MGKEGDQPYEYTAYNLDVIISVGSSEHDTKKMPIIFFDSHATLWHVP